MNSLVNHAKHAARRLQRSVEQGELSGKALAEDGQPLQRRHCLHAIAQALGFATWVQARQVLQLEALADRGTFMFHDSGGAIWNIWSASYPEARQIREESGGFLLPYKRQFQIVEPPYIALLGIDPKDPDWQAIGFNWVEPEDAEAWARLARQRMHVLLAG